MEVKIKDGNGYVNAEWTIEDGIMVVSPKEVFNPKDGEVVSVEGFNKYVFIYKDEITKEAYYYVAFSIKKGRVEFPDGGHIGYVSQLRPATEEEKKLLFDKLAENGFEWDAERKELVKLKWKPKDGEKYYYPYFNIMEKCFMTQYAAWPGIYSEENGYKKGWVFKTEEECQAFCDRLNKAIENIKP